MPLTPLYRQGLPLTPLAFRLNAVNAVILKRNASTKNSIFLHQEESKSLLHSKLFLTEDFETYRPIFRQKFGETNGALNSDVNVVALLV